MPSRDTGFLTISGSVTGFTDVLADDYFFRLWR
jgi:hypothetical protein